MKTELVYSIFVLGVVFLGGCAALNTATGKTAIEEKLVNTEKQLATSKAQEVKLSDANTKLEQQLSAEQAKYTRDVQEFEKKIEMEKVKVKGMPVMLFSGDIVYEIAIEGFKDYRASLRYRSLLNETFKTSLDQFEAGKGGDPVMLGILKEIDVSSDRLISPDEALRFRKAEEEKYSDRK